MQFFTAKERQPQSNVTQSSTVDQEIPCWETFMFIYVRTYAYYTNGCTAIQLSLLPLAAWFNIPLPFLL